MYMYMYICTYIRIRTHIYIYMYIMDKRMHVCTLHIHHTYITYVQPSDASAEAKPQLVKPIRLGLYTLYRHWQITNIVSRTMRMFDTAAILSEPHSEGDSEASRVSSRL